MKKQKFKLTSLSLKQLLKELKKLKLLHWLNRKKLRKQLLNGKNKQQKPKRRPKQI